MFILGNEFDFSDWASAVSFRNFVADGVLSCSIVSTFSVTSRASIVRVGSDGLCERCTVAFTANPNIVEFLLDHGGSGWLIVALVLIIVHASVIDLKVMLPGRHVPHVRAVASLNSSTPDFGPDGAVASRAVFVFRQYNICDWS